MSLTDLSPKRRTLITSVLMIAAIMDLLDSTVVNVAIPSIQTHLHASSSAIQWIIAGYSLSFALLLITAGRLGDIFGYKKLLLIGVGSFTLLSLVSGLAPTAHWLVVARLLQGLAAALMTPQTSSFMQVLYKPAERTKILGFFGAIGGTAAAMGPIIGGFIIAGNWFNLSWRPIFLINVPVGIIALIACGALLPEAKSDHKLKIDVPGTFLATVALGLFTYPLIEGRELGWPAWIYAMMVASVPVFIGFIRYELGRERHGLSTLVVPGLFKIRSFASGWFINLVAEIAGAGVLLITTLTLQLGYGFSALRASLATLPLIVGLVITMTLLLNRLIKKLGKYIFVLGSVGTALGFAIAGWTFEHYGASLAAWQLAPSLLLAGASLGFIVGPVFAITLQDVDTANAGSASGLVEVTEQLGGAVGVALVGTIFFNRLLVAGGSHIHSFNSAYIYGLALVIGLYIAVAVISLAAPRHFKTEDELSVKA